VPSTEYRVQGSSSTRNSSPTAHQCLIAESVRPADMILLQLHKAAQDVERVVILGCGPPILVRAALDAVRQWRYRPYILNGQPIEVETEITVNFKLGG